MKHFVNFYSCQLGDCQAKSGIELPAMAAIGERPRDCSVLDDAKVLYHTKGTRNTNYVLFKYSSLRDTYENPAGV